MRHLLPLLLVSTGCAGAPATPPSPPGLPAPGARLPGRAVGLAAGAMHTCAVFADGHVSCWGSNERGQLGQGLEARVEAAWSPIRVRGLEAVTRVASGDRHTCALTASGEVWCWGGNSRKQLGDGTTSARAAPTRVPLPGPARAVRARGARTCAVELEDESRSWCWGDGAEVMSATEAATQEGITLRKWELDGIGQPRLVGEDEPSMRLPSDGRVVQGSMFVELSEGYEHACMRTEDGAIWCAGDNGSGQLGVGDRALARSGAPVEQPRLTCASVHQDAGGRYCVMTPAYLDDPSGPSRHGMFHADPHPRTLRHGPAIEVDPNTGQIIARGRYDLGVRTGRWDVHSRDGRVRGHGALSNGSLETRSGLWELTLGGERQWGVYGQHGTPVGEWRWTRADGSRFEAVFDGSGKQQRWALTLSEDHDYTVRLSGDRVYITVSRTMRGWGASTDVVTAGLPDAWVPGETTPDADAFAYEYPLIEYVMEAVDIDEEEDE